MTDKLCLICLSQNIRHPRGVKERRLLGCPFIVSRVRLAMTQFEEPAFFKPTHPKGDVIVFGTSPELEIEDSKSGLARFGGFWRAPDYLTAYVRSAEILIEHAAKTNALDDIALPAFYMQRHALELLIKRLLSWLYEAAEYRSELGQASTWAPSARQKRFQEVAQSPESSARPAFFE